MWCDVAGNGSEPTTVLVARSILNSWSALVVTSIVPPSPGLSVIANGAPVTGISPVCVFDATSTILTLLLPRFVTYAVDPVGLNAMMTGNEPTGIDVVSASVVRSSRAIEPSCNWATKAVLPNVVIPIGPPGTSIRGGG